MSHHKRTRNKVLSYESVRRSGCVLAYLDNPWGNLFSKNYSTVKLQTSHFLQPQSNAPCMYNAHILAVLYEMLGRRCLSNACQAWGCARLHAQGLPCAVLPDTVLGKRLHIKDAGTVEQPGYTDMRHACYLLLVGTGLAKNNAGP